MVITKVEDVTRQGSCKILWRKLRLRGGLLLVLIKFLGGGVGVVAYLSLSASGRKVGCGGRLFEVGRLLTFSAFRMGAYSRWALIRGWALIQINTVSFCLLFLSTRSSETTKCWELKVYALLWVSIWVSMCCSLGLSILEFFPYVYFALQDDYIF